MEILFNSDLLYATSLIKDKLPRQVYEFLSACKKNGHEIVIPLTTLLEFNKKQSEFVNKEMLALKNAGTKLANYGIKVHEFNSLDLIRSPDLIQLIKDTGISCTMKEPTKNDYENAHRRACLRESPHPPDIKSDEMRDLVIWEISIRISQENNGAILMSRDEVHTHHRGDKEASEVNLIRCNSIERAYETLSIETASAKKIKQLLNSVWNQILESDLPCVSGCQIISISSPIFEDTLQGYSLVNCLISLQTGGGKQLDANLYVSYYEDQVYTVEFKNILIGDKISKDIALTFKRPNNIDLDLSERKANLEKLLRGDA